MILHDAESGRAGLIRAEGPFVDYGVVAGVVEYGGGDPGFHEEPPAEVDASDRLGAIGEGGGDGVVGAGRGEGEREGEGEKGKEREEHWSGVEENAICLDVVEDINSK